VNSFKFVVPSYQRHFAHRPNVITNGLTNVGPTLDCQLYSVMPKLR